MNNVTLAIQYKNHLRLLQASTKIIGQLTIKRHLDRNHVRYEERS